jgi:hypothetical protein
LAFPIARVLTSEEGAAEATLAIRKMMVVKYLMPAAVRWLVGRDKRRKNVEEVEGGRNSTS